MKIKILEDVHQSFADSKSLDIGELAGFCLGADGRPYAIIVNTKNNKFDMTEIYNIERIKI